jgi:hypothetical protein
MVVRSSTPPSMGAMSRFFPRLLMAGPKRASSERARVFIGQYPLVTWFQVRCSIARPCLIKKAQSRASECVQRQVSGGSDTFVYQSPCLQNTCTIRVSFLHGRRGGARTAKQRTESWVAEFSLAFRWTIALVSPSSHAHHVHCVVTPCTRYREAVATHVRCCSQ